MSLTCSLANNSVHNPKENLKKAREYYNSEADKYRIRKNKMKVHLTTILKDVKQYKAKNERTNKKLLSQLSSLKREFNSYKAKKKKEIKKINNKLYTTKKELSKNRKKLISVQKKIIRTNTIKKSKKREIAIVSEPIEIFIPNHVEVVYNKPQIPIQMPSNTQWVEMVVQDEINIYQLALLYYGDAQRYKEIYSANQHIIGKDLKINNGMSLRIPMTDLFEEQPIMLNTY
jgi:exonuclease VII large subunit